MKNKRTRSIFLGCLLFAFSQHVLLWGQEKKEPSSSDYTQKLEERIQILEETVKGLQEQLQPGTSTSRSPKKTETTQAAQPVEQALIPEPKPDRAVKINGLAFGDFYWVQGNHDNSLEDRNGFWMRRMYLTFNKSLTDTIDARVRFEASSPGDFTTKRKMEPIIKDLYLRWKFSKLHQTYIGLSSTPTWGVVEGFWGYRAVEKTVLDLQKLGSSRELGVAFKGSFDTDKKVRYHFMLGNGSGTSSETNEGKKALFSLGFYPTSSLVLEFYADYDNRPLETDRRTFQGFLGFQGDSGRVGVQYAHQIREGSSNLNLDALSVFGFHKLTPHVSLIGRVDRMFDPNPDGHKISYIPFDPTAKSTLFLAGLDLKISEGFSLIPNVEVIRYDKREDGTQPETDLIPRITFYYKF
jgi:hypothetical protein